ncbi:Lrp/AsnC family transcriptional regulator [Maritimibacter sp. UBA3975]|uniref:Lrp/AsnC family transcriptional regulator n=1 Tax=Maritimibacter sp. UBA3975 TaxID=1946833 RepID=UPI000C09458A|nr:Lrp/AsnC family transcriptional regulator [Maritimibacter sp. UBA3975]MAM61765.1 AsnC family transcriptional regulator [Maritimibacter sp.]|tara:strand:- start:2042 stop:2512 length:471 start_codon:yes stop_codon:yes gene_type:complete
MAHQIEIDDRDRKIVSILQQDSRISNADLAGRTGMSTSACWRRVKALEEAGIIARYGAVVDQEKLGLRFQAIVEVQLIRHDPGEVADFIRALEVRPEVQECFATTGDADYHMRVVCEDIATYNRFLEEFLFRQTAVRAAQTNVVLKNVKRATGLTV